MKRRLVLTRKLGQGILIDGDRIRVSPIERNGKEFRIMIEADEDVIISREEVYDERLNKQDGRGNYDGK